MEFNPSSFAIRNGNFVGLPFTFDNSTIHLISVPWDATVSSGDGTSGGPENILESSYQLDLEDPEIEDAWKSGIYFLPVDEEIKNKSKLARSYATRAIQMLENGEDMQASQLLIEKTNELCEDLIKWTENQATRSLKMGKLVGFIGGDHSIPLGFLRALKKYNTFPFGILQIDAHMDLRKEYEGFKYSHASIFHNVIEEAIPSSLTQIGIRDFCKEEVDFAKDSLIPMHIFKDFEIKSAQFNGKNFNEISELIIQTLPEFVYISFDIDGLEPSLCPNTGTPVPGGFSFQEIQFLLSQVIQSGRKVIGFDVSEVAGLPNEWDGNVGARIVYKLATLMAKSFGKV